MAEAHNRLNIVILDACRNNPLPKGRSLSRGLARMDAPSGTFIAYAAGPGQTAEDGSAGGNGVFTGELVKAIVLPGLPIEQVFKKAAAGVRSQTGDRQVPWTEASLQGDFFFHPAGTSSVIAAAPAAAPASPAAAATDAGAFELAFWNSVKDAKSPAEIKTYLDRYPKGAFAGIARVRYDELQATAANAAKPRAQVASSRDALASDAAPSPAAAMNSRGSALPAHPPNGFADELADFGVQPQSTLKLDVGSATPTSIPGGHVITTEALVGFSRNALLIDAWQDRYHPTVPGAIRMWGRVLRAISTIRSSHTSSKGWPCGPTTIRSSHWCFLPRRAMLGIVQRSAAGPADGVSRSLLVSRRARRLARGRIAAIPTLDLRPPANSRC